MDDGLLAETVARHRLWAMPLSSCYLGPPTRRGLVLGYGGTEARLIPAGVRRLRAVLESLQQAPAEGGPTLQSGWRNGR